MQGQCRLCLKDKELKRLHILPEFMYENVYDPTPKRFFSMTINSADIQNSKQKVEQKGIREYLLCGDCEVLLSKYEKYVAETIYGKNKRNKTYIVKQSQSPDEQFFEYHYAGFEYKEFRIFLLSILWRLCISETFQTPKIKDTEIEMLRTAILKENTLEYDDFGCLFQVIKYKKGQLVKGIILEPFLTGTDNNRILNVLIDGFMLSYFLDSKNLPNDKKYPFVKFDGTMRILGRTIFTDKGLLEKLKGTFDFFRLKGK